METVKTVNIIFYTADSGKQPFVEWQKKLSVKAKAIVLARLARIRSGNFGDCKQISGGYGVHELRIDCGPGFRIYYGKKGTTKGTTIVVLLVGGDKGSQSRDIAKAKQYWVNFKEDV